MQACATTSAAASRSCTLVWAPVRRCLGSAGLKMLMGCTRAGAFTRLASSPLEVALSARGQRQEVHHQALLARVAALGHKLPLVVGVFDLLVPIHAARMQRDELVAVIDAHARSA